MCILLKLDYGKFCVSNLFFSKVMEEKPFGGSARLPPLVKEGLKELIFLALADILCKES